MRSISLEAVLLLWLSSIGAGHPHPLHDKGSRLIVGTLVRLRRAASADAKAVTTEEPDLMAATAPDNGGGEAVKDPSKDSDDSLSGLDNKILLLMIVPPDKMKAKLVTKAKNKKKLSGRSAIVSRPRASKAHCAAELQKKLEIAENLARQLLTNSSMALLASQADTKNAGPLINKISDAIESKIKYVSDVRPVINCEETCDSTPKEVATTSTAPATTAKPTAAPTTTSVPELTSTVTVTTPCDVDTTVKACPESNRKTSAPAPRKPGTPKIRVSSS